MDTLEAMETIRIFPESHTPTLCVSDVAEITIPADRAILHIDLQVNIREQKSPLPLATEIDKVRSVLQDLRYLKSQGESIRKNADYKDKITTHWTSKYIVENAADPEVQAELQDVISRLAGIEYCLINGPNWVLSPHQETEMTVAAQTQALQHAKARAMKLAGEVGYDIDEVMQLDTDTNVFQDDMMCAEQANSVQFTSSRARKPARVLDIDVTPGIVTITGRVTVTFSMKKKP